MVLDHGGDDHVVRIETQPIGEVVDGLGRVAAQDGHIGPVRITAGERQHGTSGLLVGVGGPPGPESGTPVDARVRGQELGHASGHVRVGLRGRRLVELNGAALDTSQAGHGETHADQEGQGSGRVMGIRAGPSCHGGLHTATLGDNPAGGGTLRTMQTRWSSEANDGDGTVDVGTFPTPTVREGGAEDGGGAVAADDPNDGTGAEEEAHRSAVDAVDGVLDEVERALARLDDGTYGRCEECGAPIDDARLADSPIERTCGTCVIGGTGAAPGVDAAPDDGVAVRSAAGPVGLSAATGHHGD